MLAVNYRKIFGACFVIAFIVTCMVTALGSLGGRVMGTRETFMGHSNVHRILRASQRFQYRYNLGEVLKYKVQMTVWDKKYVDEGPRAFHPVTYNIFLNQKIVGVSSREILMEVEVDLSEIKDSFLWGEEIALFKDSGKFLVRIVPGNWTVDVESLLNSSGNHISIIQGVLEEIIPHITQPVFFPEDIDIWDTPEFLGKTTFTRKTSGISFSADVFSIMRGFFEYCQKTCVILDNIIVTKAFDGQECFIYGTVIFDYVKGIVLEVDYSGNMDSRFIEEKDPGGRAFFKLHAEFVS